MAEAKPGRYRITVTETRRRTGVIELNEDDCAAAEALDLAIIVALSDGASLDDESQWLDDVEIDTAEPACQKAT